MEGKFYKYEREKWFCSEEIVLANSGDVLNEQNKENDNGWIWHDTPPQEYLDVLEEQENVMVFDGDLDDFKIAHPNILEQDQI